MKQNNDVIEIDVWKLIVACVNRWWVILLVTALFGAASFLGTRFLVTPTYESTIKIYVNNSEINVGNLSISASDLSASIKLVDVYEVILNTKDTLDEVIRQANLDYTYKDVMGMLKTSAVKDTQVFQVTVTSTSPKEARVIAATIGKVLPDVIGNIIDSADARIVEHAIVPTQRSGPSYSRNTILGAFLGMLLSVLFIAILELMDITVKDERDVAELTDIPILTHIPVFDEAAKQSNHRKYSYYYYAPYRKRGERHER